MRQLNRDSLYTYTYLLDTSSINTHAYQRFPLHMNLFSRSFRYKCTCLIEMSVLINKLQTLWCRLWFRPAALDTSDQVTKWWPSVRRWGRPSGPGPQPSKGPSLGFTAPPMSIGCFPVSKLTRQGKILAGTITVPPGVPPGHSVLPTPPSLPTRSCLVL